MTKSKLTVGVDFGSDSARAILVDLESGQTVSEASMEYPRWKKRLYCDVSRQQYRQHPQDYLDVLEKIIPEILKKTGENAGERVIGIAVDTTGSTVCPVDKNGVPLALLQGFEENPDAMFHLWKDHTALEEASELNRAFSSGSVDYTKYQGEYSSEWFWAKILHTTRKNKNIYNAAYNWVEHCDWIVGMLCGKMNGDVPVRSACAAGHKALWNSHFKGLPERSCLTAIDPYLGNIYDRYSIPLPAGSYAGRITEGWALKLGISPETAVGIGSFDAHAGAVGAGISPHTMVKVLGTSTVDMMIVDETEVAGKKLREYCGMAEDSIVPGYIGMEMGQSSFGDALAWFRDLLLWPITNAKIPETILDTETRNKIMHYCEENLIHDLEESTDVEDFGLTALDWFNGRRYPQLNESAKAAVSGLTLGTTAPELYGALSRAIVMGSKAIYDSLVSAGLEINRVICTGGIANKSPYIMQMLSDTLGTPIMVCKENQCCARGAAIFAAVAAGYYSGVEEAQKHLCESYHINYVPNRDQKKNYSDMYAKYLSLGKFVESLQA